MILWLRRDLRLGDHPALHAALQTGRPIIPVFILDPEFTEMGAAPKWRLEQALASFAERLEGVGSRLILRAGDALSVLQDLLESTGAQAVHWSRQYTPQGIERDKKIKATLKAQGVQAASFTGFVLFEPWTVETGTGGPYKVFTPFWRKVRERSLNEVLPAPESLLAPSSWPKSEALPDWKLSAAMNRGAAIIAKHASIGEARALQRLHGFLAERCADYPTDRDRPDRDGTSGLAEHLTYGEISTRTIWHAGREAMAQGNPGAEAFVRQLVWRDFAWHLAFNT
ncbi:MAG: deoxyribodipyrimidine photo-lyase, partial [Cognaticolwellia sp.]